MTTKTDTTNEQITKQSSGIDRNSNVISTKPWKTGNSYDLQNVSTESYIKETADQVANFNPATTKNSEEQTIDPDIAKEQAV